MSRKMIGSVACLSGLFALGLWWIAPSGSQPPPEKNLAVPPAVSSSPATRSPPDDDKLHIICFGAHPDDCELNAGGVAALWASLGHHVKFVSTTNGDIGHWRDS